MSWNKADQLLQNEARKLQTKIDGKKREITKMEADRREILARIKTE
jgi:hypothetical protein